MTAHPVAVAADVDDVTAMRSDLSHRAPAEVPICVPYRYLLGRKYWRPSRRAGRRTGFGDTLPHRIGGFGDSMMDELPLDVLRSKVSILWDNYGRYIGIASRKRGEEAREARLIADGIKRDIARYEAAVERREATEKWDGHHSP